MASHQGETPANTMQDWSGQSFGLSCDKFGDLSWQPVNNNTGAMQPLSQQNEGFAMDLCQDAYNAPLQPFDTTSHFDTVMPSQISMVDDCNSSIQSWPNSPSSLPEVITDSAHTSPDDAASDPPSSKRQSQSERKLSAAGQKRRHSASTGSPSVASVGSTSASGGNTKKKTIREKNRTAATKYRNKTKRGIAELQDTEHQLSEKNAVLNAHVDCLRNEILSLKSEILRHGTCDSPLIQDYIMKTAKSL